MYSFSGFTVSRVNEGTRICCRDDFFQDSGSISKVLSGIFFTDGDGIFTWCSIKLGFGQTVVGVSKVINIYDSRRVVLDAKLHHLPFVDPLADIDAVFEYAT